MIDDKIILGLYMLSSFVVKHGYLASYYWKENIVNGLTKTFCFVKYTIASFS